MNDTSWLENILKQETETMTDKQQAIIKAAVELFSEKGYAATSTREIAQKAGVSEGSIFKQYPTKKDLMLWITKRIINTVLVPLMSSGISELLAKDYDNREEFLTAFLQNRLGLLKEGLPLFKIILQEIPFQPEIRATLIEQFQKLPVFDIVEKMQIEENSGFSKTDAMQLFLTCVLGFFVMRNVMMPELFPDSQLQEDTVKFARFINRGLHTDQGEDL